MAAPAVRVKESEGVFGLIARIVWDCSKIVFSDSLNKHKLIYRMYSYIIGYSLNIIDL